MTRIVFLEDEQAGALAPLCLLRPVFELRCGHFSLRERLLNAFPRAEWGVVVRSYLVNSYREKHANCHVNDIAWLSAGPVILVNGRWIGQPEDLRDLSPGTVGLLGDEIAWACVDPAEFQRESPIGWWQSLRERKKSGLHTVKATGTLIAHPWDLVNENPRWIIFDHENRDPAPDDNRTPVSPLEHVAVQGSDDDIWVSSHAQLDPYVVLDARHGPIWIESGARILPFTRIEGPCYIGRESQLFRAHVREGTTIGPVCRVGGEIEESILHGYVNTYHDGFLGHSYVCPWVNLGALTTNSDLKNDYSSVRVPTADGVIDTSLTKVGCFIGDHTKTALCSLFNTGSSIGVMTMLLPAGELFPKFIPSFTRLWHGRIDELPQGIEPAIASARIAMARRNVELTAADEECLWQVFRDTQAERTAGVERSWRKIHRSAPSPVVR